MTARSPEVPADRNHGPIARGVSLDRSSERNFLLAAAVRSAACLVFPEESLASAIAGRALLSGLDSARVRANTSPSGPCYLIIGNDVSVYRVIESLAALLRHVGIDPHGSRLLNDVPGPVQSPDLRSRLCVWTESAQLLSPPPGVVGLAALDASLRADVIRVPALGSRRCVDPTTEATVDVFRSPAFGHRHSAAVLEAVSPDCIVIALPRDDSRVRRLLHDLVSLVERTKHSIGTPPSFVVATAEHPDRQLRNALSYYDLSVARVRNRSFPLGLVDVHRDASDAFCGVVSATLDRSDAPGHSATRASSGNVELTLCIRNVPGSYGVVLAQLAGLQFGPPETDASIPALDIGRLRASTTQPLRHPSSNLRGWPGFLLSARGRLVEASSASTTLRYADVIREALVLTCANELDHEARTLDRILGIGDRSSDTTPLVRAHQRSADARASFEETCACPAVRACPLTAAQRWADAASRAIRDVEATGVSRHFAQNPRFVAESLATADAAAPLAQIEVVGRFGSDPGTLATVLNQLSRRPLTGAVESDRSFNISAVQTDACHTPRYAYDKIFGRVVARRRPTHPESHVARLRQRWLRARGRTDEADDERREYPIDAVLIAPIHGTWAPWAQFALGMAAWLGARAAPMSPHGPDYVSERFDDHRLIVVSRRSFLSSLKSGPEARRRQLGWYPIDARTGTLLEVLVHAILDAKPP